MFTKTLNWQWVAYWFVCCPALGAGEHISDPYWHFLLDAALLAFCFSAAVMSAYKNYNEYARAPLYRKRLTCQFLGLVLLYASVGLLIKAGVDACVRLYV